MRVHFPAGLKSDFSFTDGHFDVLKRAAEPAADEDYFEQPMGDFPQKSFTAVGRDNDYFVLLNKGLPEAEIIHTDGQSTIALTLIRAVGWLSRDDLATRKDGHAGPGMATPGAQCLRKMFFEYAIIPRTGTAGMKLMPFIGACYNNPLMALPTDLHEGELPSSLSFLTAEPATLMVSALKQAEDNQDTILRVFNSGETETAGTVSFYRPVGSVREVNLNEKTIEAGGEKVSNLETSGDEKTITFNLRGKTIATFAIRFV